MRKGLRSALVLGAVTAAQGVRADVPGTMTVQGILRDTEGRPVDAVIMAIVDRVDVQKIDDLDREYRERSKKIDGMLAKQKET